MNPSKKILYIDDDYINVELFKINFAKKCKLLCGYSGETGLHLLNSNPDVEMIISDMRMPGMNGIEFLRKVKNINPEIKCYILTGYGITNEIKKQVDSGLIIKCFGKPFNKKEIEELLETMY